jgi:flagellar biosynthetic protein FliR
MALAIGSLLVFVRILTSILTAPLLSHARVPIIFRVALAGLLSLVTVPMLVQYETFVAVAELDLFSAVINEALIGATIGIGVTILLSAAQVAGQIIGQLAGINLTDPIGGDAAQAGGVMAGFFNMLSLAVFAMMGGPEMMVTAVLDTFHEVPLGQTLVQSELLELMGVLLGQSLSLAVRAVGPAIAALLISTLTLGFISRTMPQLNMLQFGLNANLIVLWLAVFLTLGGCVWLFVDDIQSAVDHIRISLSHQKNVSMYVPR